MMERLGWFLLRHHRLVGVVGSIAHRTTGPWRYRSWYVDKDDTQTHCWYCALMMAAMNRVPGWR